VFIPFGQFTQSEWHLYDCATKTVLSYSKPFGVVNGGYAGGAYDPLNNQIVFAPWNQAPQSQWHTFQNFGLSQISRQLAAHYLFNKF
jgi:hypothetical protein